MLVLSPLLWGLLLRITAPGRRASRDEHGASAVEYGLLVAGIAATTVGVVFVLGNDVLVDLFQHTCDSIAQETC